MTSKSKRVLTKCGMCPKTFKYNKSLRSHVQKFHLQQCERLKLSTTDENSRSNSNNSKNIIHLNTSVLHENKENIDKSQYEENNLTCNFSSRTYSSDRTLNELHIEHDSNDEVMLNRNNKWICAVCNGSYCSRAELIKHVRENQCEYHSKITRLKKSIKCNYCDKRFQRSAALNKHIRQNHPDVNVPVDKGIHFICNSCDCNFLYRKTLIRHIQDKHPKQVCHEVSHQGHNCPACSMKFEYPVNLKQHIKRYHPIESLYPKEKINKHFECNICHVSFLHCYDLTRHNLKEHPSGIAKDIVDSKPFACSFCPKRFCYKFNVRLHSLKKHAEKWNSVRSREEKKPSSVCCVHCNKWYTSKMALINHIRRKHASIIDPPSRRIKKKSPDLQTIRYSHVTRGHRFCPLCSAKFINKGKIYAHFRACHDKKVKTNSFKVENETKFNEWKRQFENDTKSKFVKYNNYKSKKEIVKILICHRSGCFQSRSRGIRQLRLTGSEKINGFCPAEVRFVHNLVTNRCEVRYIDEHIGHGQELQFLKFEEPCATLKLESELDFKLIDEPKEVNLDEKHLFDTIVLSSWISENKGSVLYIKGPEDADSEFPELSTGTDGDFIFIIMNEFQATMFAEYAPDIVAVNRMEGPEDYDFEFFVVMVVDNYRQGIPCCMMLSNRSDQYVYELLFKKLGERAGRIKPKVFMSDAREAYINAWNASMPPPERQLFCSWHVLRCWEKNLTRIACFNKRKTLRRRLRELHSELNPFRFHELLQQLLNVADEELSPFMEYFGENFVKNESTWAYCYRKYAGINTNYVCNQFFRSFRHLYLRDRSKFSLEQILDAFTLLLKNQPQQKLIREVKGKLVGKIKEARIRHAIAGEWTEERLNAVSQVTENKWYVPSEGDGDGREEIFRVEKVADECSCKLRCRECHSCLHQYRCSCLDNCIQFNMCVHIHAVCICQNKMNAADDDDLIEEVEVNVIDILPAETNDLAVYSKIMAEEYPAHQIDEG